MAACVLCNVEREEVLKLLGPDTCLGLYMHRKSTGETRWLCARCIMRGVDALVVTEQAKAGVIQ